MKKIIQSFSKLSSKKQHLEFFTALLSIPVLITVIILNLNSLNSLKKTDPSPTPTQIKQEKIFIPVQTGTSASNKETGGTPTNTLSPSGIISPTNTPCEPGIGAASITSPVEGNTITDNPVSVNIKYEPGEFCAVVWSYRINNGSWSDYDDKSIALYNLPQGNIKIDLKIKSIVSGEDQLLSRNFTYKGTSVSPLYSISPTSTASAN